MTKTVTNYGSTKNNVEYHAEVPYEVEPKTKGEKFIDGVKYYIGILGQEYRCDLFDKRFKCEKKAIKNNRHKGETIGQDFMFT